jgi:hypothetical protein
MPAQAWVTLTIGLIATAGVLITWQQKNIADRRSEWWRRVVWAYERVFSDDDVQQQLGWILLKVLIASKLATEGDTVYIQAIAEHVALMGKESNTDDEQATGVSYPAPQDV